MVRVVKWHVVDVSRMLYVVWVVERGNDIVELSVRFSVLFAEWSVRVSYEVGVSCVCKVCGCGLEVVVYEPL